MHRSITLSHEIRVSAADACWALCERTAQVLTGQAAAHDGGGGPYRTVLRVETGETVITHRANVQLGPEVVTDPSSWALRIQPTGAARLLPIFAGTLSVEEDEADTRLVLAGVYEQPLGRLGALGDGLLGGLAEQ